MTWLVFIWGAILAFAIYAYVVLDGFDLGVGILAPFARTNEEEELMISSIAPVWDGNETWLVLGGGGLMAAFPLAYSILMPAFYAPIIAMLLALIFRGVAFEFRHRNPHHRKAWTRCFVVGSLAATLAQGLVLGTFIQGIAVDGRAYAGGWFDWLSPFSVFTAVSLVAGYALLGACWLIMKTSGDVQERMYRTALPLGFAVVAAIGAVSVWTPFLGIGVVDRWFSWPNILVLSPVPLLVAALAFGLQRSIAARRERAPFALALLLFLLSYVGLGISLYPYAVPYAVTAWEAAAPDASLSFLLVGTVALMPLILGYTGYAYWVFRGKVAPGSSYH